MRYEISEVVKKDQVMELVFGNCSKPKDLLGRHFILQGQVISAYHPDAVKMEVISEDGEHYPMDTVERQPVFSLFLPHKRILFSLHCSDIHVSLYNLGPLITPALCVPLLYHIRHLIQFPDSLQGCPFKCSRIISLSLWLAG